MPLHSSRLRERGFDQALLIAEGLAQRSGRPLIRELLVRTRPTLHQVGASRAARADNLRGAFALGPERRVPRCVALVDDVVTTTATARAAAQVLRDAGAVDIRVLAIARAV